MGTQAHSTTIRRVKKRDGRIVEFAPERITEAIFKAAQAVGGSDKETAAELTLKIMTILEYKYDIYEVPTVEDIQDIVERVLIKSGHSKTAKAYILYRQKRAELRKSGAFLDKVTHIVDGYVDKGNWRVKENSNTSYAISGLQAHISGAVIAEYTLENIYPKEIADAHRKADFHIHDLSVGTFAGYCAGWSIKDILQKGFNGVRGRVAARPAKHLNALLGQLVNFLGTLQNEWAGAQAFSSFDTYLAPFARADNLSYGQIKQCMQEFVFSINQTSRWGNQVPFTNLTFDWIVPPDMKKEKVILDGKFLDSTYGEYQKEMDMINKAFMEVMSDGDMDGRIFTFPIPTYNMTKDFDWDSENAQLLFEMTAKYGTPYFQNFINSTLNPSDVRSMCCRLQLDVRQLRNKTGGLFGSGEKTGSVGVVTINMPRLGYTSKSKEEFFQKLEHLMVLASTSLEIKRKEVTRNMKGGLLPYTMEYLGSLEHHFSTIGINGMNECCLNFLGKDITTKEGKAFTLEVLDFMREKLKGFQETTGNIYNLEATPAEGTTYRFAKHDRETFPDIITAGTEEAPYYTNSSQLPVNHTEDVFEALDHQDELQCRYTGGTVLHGFIGEKISDWKVAREMVRKVMSNYKLPYFSITPTFSICPVHGYISGEHFECPHEHSPEQLEKFGIEV
ncbi:MAG TPA: ribonucleoside triphosphate reductase [Candidatus Nanoarchaeia archaeon]|nr:ribonucleoside triphosphate reductase [Candidatus Nanoarchaeia archaeon]